MTKPNNILFTNVPSGDPVTLEMVQFFCQEMPVHLGRPITREYLMEKLGFNERGLGRRLAGITPWVRRPRKYTKDTIKQRLKNGKEVLTETDYSPLIKLSKLMDEKPSKFIPKHRFLYRGLNVDELTHLSENYGCEFVISNVSWV